MAYLNKTQLESLKFASIGNNVLISDKASIYGAGRIHIGNNVRIDDFCVLSAGDGGIEIGSYIHIAIYSSLIGAGKIILGDFCNISSRVSIYSSNDDYSGEYMTNPMVPRMFTNITCSNVILKKHVIVGSGSVLLPGITVHEGTAIGALSLVCSDCESYSVYAGVKAKRIKSRKRGLIDKEILFMKDMDR